MQTSQKNMKISQNWWENYIFFSKMEAILHMIETYNYTYDYAQQHITMHMTETEKKALHILLNILLENF